MYDLSTRPGRISAAVPYLLLFFFALSAPMQPVYARSLQKQFVDAAIARTRQEVRYDGSYRQIPYPDGDVPRNTGVCTDVVVRTYRKIGVDLQQLVHQDMRQNFQEYPSLELWGLTGPDTNIDHRRVANLQVFFKRHGKVLPITGQAADYLPGDIVTWVLPNHRPHIGIVSDRTALISRHPMIVHNIGAGPELEDMLFDYKISGHFRYMPQD